ncbi:MAG: hypothetical protein AAGH15_24080, partial [Myxococcota bacterium]
ALALTRLGRATLEGRPLDALGTALRDALLGGEPTPRALERGLGPAGMPRLAAWRDLGLVAPPRRGSNALLLQKRRALARRAAPQELLGLPAGDRTNARSALRQLARELHPDRFDPALAATSGEVLRALLDAEASLR